VRDPHTQTDRQTVHTHTHTPTAKICILSRGVEVAEATTTGLEKKITLQHNNCDTMKDTYQSCPQSCCFLLSISLSFCLSIPLNLSGEIKTDQNVIFKSLNLYKIASRKPKRGTTKTIAKQATQRCLPTNSLTCLSVEGVIAYNNNIIALFSLSSFAFSDLAASISGP